MGLQTYIWFGVAGAAAALGVSLLYARYVRRDANAVRSGGGFTLFALFMFACAAGAFTAGIVAARAGR
ncbi:MAG TPA: hypothetical protein VER37_01910 [Thermomicrobiales bacterium]|nr:hypothetical protein [Thermomicrobiales bacterium]